MEDNDGEIKIDLESAQLADTWGGLRSIDPKFLPRHEFDWGAAGLLTETTDIADVTAATIGFDRAWKSLSGEGTIPPYELVLSFRYLTNQDGSELTTHEIQIGVRPTEGQITLQDLKDFKSAVHREFVKERPKSS